jgi:hypothetical protein
MTRCSCEAPFSCSLDRAIFTLGRDCALRRSHLRKRWQDSHPLSGTNQTASGKMPRQTKTAIEHPAIHTNES